MAELPTSREHRTAIVFDVRSGLNTEYSERAARLLTSLNGNDIKVDILTLTEQPSAAKLALVPGAPADVVNPEVPEADEEGVDLRSWAKGLGYVQLLVSVPLA